MRIYDITQPCALSGLSKSGAPVVRANAGTRVFSVQAPAASATRAFSRAAGCAGAEGLERIPSGWRSRELSAGNKLGLKQVASPAGVGLEVRRPVVIDGERLASPAALTALVADGRGSSLMSEQQDRQDQHKQQDQFGTTGVGSDGYAFGTAHGTNPIDPRDFRTSSPPG